MSSSHAVVHPANSAPSVHPRGSKATILLASVFGPYARDDQYGSRRLNPMELYQNQVTRAEGPFSLRMFHRSWGIMLIQANITAPCVVLDFPTMDRFVQELREHDYDVIGITSILPNIGKVQTMCRLIRELQPHATIVVGGHIANMPGIERKIEADHIVRGEGVRWFRQFLGEDATQPIRHPVISSAVWTRTMGMPISNSGKHAAATVIPSVGCPMGCNFCATSAMFGGKGKFVNFYETGEELFRVMCGLEQAMKVRAFFVMDENFLLHKKRALRLLELIEQYGKSWSLYVFSSAHVIRSYEMEQLVRLGISWVWMGLEGRKSRYEKLQGIDTRQLVGDLQSHGIRVLGSSIIGLEEHTPDNITDVIEYAISHNTDFHQFMLYTPIPGTALYAEHLAAQTLLDPSQYDEADVHGQFMFRHKHPNIPQGQERDIILKAFQRDFDVNGPSVLRIARTLLKGWKKYRSHGDRRIRNRFAWEAKDLALTYPASLWAARRWFRPHNPQLAQKLAGLLQDIQKEVGLKARLAAPLAGRLVFSALHREARQLKDGKTYEPPTFYEMNEAMRGALRHSKWAAALSRYVTAS